MKNQKGVTLITLIVYIIVLTIVISILSMISQSFFNNIKYVTERGKYVSEFNKFNMYFIKDIKNNKDTLECTQNRVVLEDGTIYTFNKEEKSIYRNKVKICNNINACNFSKEETNPQEIGKIKKIIKVKMIIKGTKNVKTTNEYVLRYW